MSQLDWLHSREEAGGSKRLTLGLMVPAYKVQGRKGKEKRRQKGEEGTQRIGREKVKRKSKKTKRKKMR